MWLAFTGSLGTSLGVDVCELMSKYSARISDSVMMSPKNAPTNCQNTRPLSISIHHYPPWASPLGRLTTSRSLRSLKPLAVENIRHHEDSWSVNTEAAWSCRVCQICQVTTVGLQARNFTAWIDRFLVFIFHCPGKHDVAQSNVSPSLYWPKWIQMACGSCKYCSQPGYCAILDHPYTLNLGKSQQCKHESMQRVVAVFSSSSSPTVRKVLLTRWLITCFLQL